MQSLLPTITAAALAALTLCVLPIPHELTVPIAFAQGQTADQQTEKAAINHMMRAYSDAFAHGDTSAVVQHYYNAPFMVISATGVKVLSTDAEVEANYVALLHDLKEHGYSHSSWSELHVKQLGQTNALVSAVAVRHKTDGTELATIGATYLLHKVNGEWRIVAVTGHPPSDVVRAD